MTNVLFSLLFEEKHVLPYACIVFHKRPSRMLPSTLGSAAVWHQPLVLFSNVCNDYGRDKQGCGAVCQDSDTKNSSASPNILKLLLSHTFKMSKAFIIHQMGKLSRAIICLLPRDSSGTV